MAPSLVAHAIRARLKADHHDCDATEYVGQACCVMTKLWAEDIQDILDMAEEMKIK